MTPGFKRNPNFSNKEINLLVDLVVDNKGLLEPDKTCGQDGWRTKNAAWNRISEEFNKRLKSDTRTPKCLRAKYDNLKKILRKKLAENKSFLEVNDSGDLVVDALPVTSYEKKLIGNVLKVTPDLLASWGGLIEYDESPEWVKEEERQTDDDRDIATDQDQVHQAISESFLMSMIDSSSDGESTYAEVPIKRTKGENNSSKIAGNPSACVAIDQNANGTNRRQTNAHENRTNGTPDSRAKD